MNSDFDFEETKDLKYYSENSFVLFGSKILLVNTKSQVIFHVARGESNKNFKFDFELAITTWFF